MRFDDSLRTVLKADASTPVGARSAWLQLVDLAGRGRTRSDETVIARLRMLRDAVPAEVRAASARALVHARPDARLVAFFAEDALAIAATVLRAADLAAADWIALLPRLSPALRAVLRRRGDLPAEVARALESFGPVDFALPPPERDVLELRPEMIAEPDPAAEAPAGGETGMGWRDVLAIPDLVARIEAFRRRRSGAAPEASAPGPGDAPEGFRFETDAAGTIIGVEGVARGALAGLSIARTGVQGVARVDGVAAGAFRRRSRFQDARLEVGGVSDAAGSWRLSGVPGFDAGSGRFTGFRGAGRRPRADEDAAPADRASAPSPDSLRELVHELRTPANAIAGFAELIESELLGPVPGAYRERASEIRARAAALLAAIEDLDTGSRIEMGALTLDPKSVALQPLLEAVMADFAPLAAMRGVRVAVDGDRHARLLADCRAAERLIGRLLATVVAAGSEAETIRLSVGIATGVVEIALNRPRALLGLDGEALLALEDGEDVAGAPLLGAGFAFRVARKLAAELDGALEFGPERLTLRLPAALDQPAEHATIF